MKRTLTITLPWPPSVNHYWRRVGARTLISKKGRRYRELVDYMVTSLHREKITGRCRMVLDFWPPDRRKRDLDNLPKGLLDALVKSRVIVDDSLIDDLSLHRRDPEPPDGRVLVTIEEM